MSSERSSSSYSPLNHLIDAQVCFFPLFFLLLNLGCFCRIRIWGDTIKNFHCICRGLQKSCSLDFVLAMSDLR